MVGYILLLGGILSLTLAVLGIFLPLLPTVPLVLLASFFFSKSSSRFHGWLLNNRFFGSVIRDWEETRSMPLKAKIISILVLTLSIGLSVIFFVNNALVRFILIMVAIGVSTYIFHIPGTGNAGALRPKGVGERRTCIGKVRTKNKGNGVKLHEKRIDNLLEWNGKYGEDGFGFGRRS